MKKLLALLSIGLLTLGFSSHASAWTYTVVGDYTCNTRTGQYDLDWKINNPEHQKLTVHASDRTSVPVGTEVVKEGSVDLTESVAGTETSVALNIKVNWPGDKQLRSRVATITLNGDCKPPVPPTTSIPEPTPQPTPEIVVTPVVTSPVEVTPEVEVPHFGK